MYGIDLDHWRKLWTILERRHQRRQQMMAEIEGECGSPIVFEFKQLVGDPTQELAEVPESWLLPEEIRAVQQLWEEAGENQDCIQAVREVVPEPVLRYLGLIA